MAKKDVVVTLEFTDKGSAKIKKVVKDTEKQLKGLGKTAKDSGKGFKKMDDEVKKSTAGMSKFKGMMKSTVVQMAAGMGLMQLGTMAIRGIKQAITDTINTGREFEREWANVTTMLTISTEAAEKMKWELVKLSPVLGDTTDLAKGMYQVLSASVEASKAIMFLGEAAKSAQAGVTTTATAVDALTTVVNAYGMEAEDVTKVSDIMFQTVKRGKLTYEGMAGALGTVVPVAAQVGIRFEEVAAAMATLTRQGVDVNTTTVQIRQILVSVLKPTKDASDEAKRLGIEFTSTALRTKGFAKFLADVKTKTKGNVDSLTKLFGNIRALGGVMALAGKNAEAFAYDLELMGKAAGSTEEAFQKQMQSADFWMKVAKNTIKKLQIAIYEGLVGPFKEGITTSEDLTKSISGLIDNVKALGTVIGTAGKLTFDNFTKKVQQANLAVEIFNATLETLKNFKLPTAENVSQTMLDMRIAKKVAEDFSHLGVTADQVKERFDESAEAGIKLVNQLSLMDKGLKQTSGDLATYGGVFGQLSSNMMSVAMAHRETISEIYATAKSSDEAQEAVRAYRKTWEDVGKELVDTGDKMKEFKEKMKGLGAVFEKDLKARLNELITTLAKYKEKLSPTSVINMTAEIKKLNIELGIQDEIVNTVIPDTTKLTIGFSDYQKIMAGANIETNKAVQSLGFLSPFLIQAVEGIKKLSGKLSILGIKTLPMMTTELKHAEDAFRDLIASGVEIAPEQMVIGIEGIIARMKAMGIKEIPEFWTNLLKENKKAASILAEDWMESFAQVGMLLGLLGDQIGGTFGDLISTVGLGFQQAMELAKDESKSFADILGALAPIIGDIGGKIGEMISGATDSFAKLGSSLGGTIGGMFGPLGKAIGSFAGGILGGLFKKKKTPEQIAQEEAAKAAKILEEQIKAVTKVLSKFGEVSEATAEKIVESTKSMEGFAAVSKNFADVIRDVGVTQENINDLWERTQDIIHHVTDGFLSAEDGAKALGESFTLLVDGAKELGQEGSAAMILFIQKIRESGIQVAEVTDYVLNQLDRIPTSLSALIKGKGGRGSLEGLGRIAEQTFNAMIANGRSYMDSLKAMKGPLQDLFDAYEKRKEALPSYLQGLSDMMDKMELKPHIFENLDAATNVLEALQNSAYLTQGAFDELSRSAAHFAKTILDVKGNLNAALKSMTLTESQIQQLLPVVAQFVGAAALFGLGIPAWMKTFVTKQLGVDWGDFKNVAKTQANAGIATVEEINKLRKDALPKQTKSLREKMHEETNKLWNKLDQTRVDLLSALGVVTSAIDTSVPATGKKSADEAGADMGAAEGYHGTVDKPTTILVHPDELIDITPMNKASSGGGGTTVFAPSFNLLDAEGTRELVENRLFPEFINLLNSNKRGEKTELREAAEIE